MAFVFEKIGQHLIVTDDTSGDVVFQAPTHATFFDSYLLENDSKVVLYDTSRTSTREARKFIPISIEGTEDSEGNTFTPTTFRAFMASITGFDVALDSEGAVMINRGKNDPLNTSTTPLGIGGSFTGTENINDYPDIGVTLATDQIGVLYLEFSPDGTNWDSSISIPYDPNEIFAPAIYSCLPRYQRVRFENTSGVAQTYFRLNTYQGDFSKLTSALNSVIPQTLGATVTRPIDFNLMVAKDLYQGHQATVKDGINFDIDTGSTPEDIWDGGGLYTGFVTTAQAGEIVVAGSDTGTVYYSYMESPTDTAYQFGSIVISGAGTYPLGHNIWRSNYMLFDNGSTFNVSNITLRHTATPANIFNVLLAGYGQTYNGAYTVPQGHSIHLDRITGSIRGGNTGAYADGFIYYKEPGKSPLLRFPFVLNNGSLYFDDVDYLIRIPEGTDLMPHVESVGNNNTVVHISYRIVKVKE